MERPDELNPNADVEQLKAEISDTQAELQQTVAEIQDRLSPAHLKDQAADTMREAATNVREATIGRMQHMVRGQNPIPYALIGVGAAWLLMNNRRRRSGGDGEYDTSWSASTSYISSEDEFASPYAGEEFGTMSGEREQWGSETQSRAAELRSQARQRAAEISSQARDRARRVATQARGRLDTMLQDNPMALGIAALAAGALVGASLPRTHVEDEYLGETREKLVESARTMAQETVQKATGAQEQRGQA